MRLVTNSVTRPEQKSTKKKAPYDEDSSQTGLAFPDPFKLRFSSIQKTHLPRTDAPQGRQSGRLH